MNSQAETLDPQLTTPVIPVRRGFRWLRLPRGTIPALVLAGLGICVLAVRLTTPDWRGVGARNAPPSPLPRVTAAAKELVGPPIAGNIEVRVVPVPAAVAVADPEPPASSVAIHINRAPRVDTPKRDPVSAGPPDPEPPIVAGPEAATRVWRDIELEAARVAAERARLESLKPVLRESAERASDDRDREERSVFLGRLHAALTAGKPGLQTLRDAAPEALGAAMAHRIDPLAVRTRSARRVWVLHERTNGMDESRIFAALVEVLMWDKGSRNGPRHRDEALVRGAQELLAVPVDTALAIVPSGHDQDEPVLAPAPRPADTPERQIRSRRRR